MQKRKRKSKEETEAKINGEKIGGKKEYMFLNH